MTSELRNDIREQPIPTCPMIDEIIKELNFIQREIRNYDKAEEAELRDVLSQVEWRLFSWRNSFEDQLEKIRTNVSAIRDWGEEWKVLALDSIEQLDIISDVEEEKKLIENR